MAPRSDIACRDLKNLRAYRPAWGTALLPLIDVVDQRGMFAESRVLQTRNRCRGARIRARLRSYPVYMGVKHADNPMPDMLTVANAYRENALVLRYWLASKLGCPDAVLRERLDTDPLASEYVAAC